MFLITDVLVEAKIYLSTRSLSLISKDLTLLTSEALVCGKECGSGGRHYSLMRKYWQGVNYTLGSKLRIKTQTRLISITRVAAGSLWPFPSPRLPFYLADPPDRKLIGRGKEGGKGNPYLLSGG